MWSSRRHRGIETDNLSIETCVQWHHNISFCLFVATTANTRAQGTLLPSPEFPGCCSVQDQVNMIMIDRPFYQLCYTMSWDNYRRFERFAAAVNFQCWKFETALPWQFRSGTRMILALQLWSSDCGEL